MKRLFNFFSLCSLVCLVPIVAGAESAGDPAGIAIHNRIIFKIDDEHVVTTLDVIHKLNVLFHTTYPQLADSLSARSQYYTAMWPMVLESVIDECLMEADARAKKIEVDPTIVNQEIEEMFAGDPSPFLHLFDMSLEDLFRVVHRLLLSQRIMGMMVRSKALMRVTPGKIREYYQELTAAALRTKIWKYRVLTIKSSTDALAYQIASKLCIRLNETKSWDRDRLHALVLSQGGQLICSDEFTRDDNELSDSHRIELEEVGYPQIICGEPKVRAAGVKVFVVLGQETQSIEPLDQVETQLKQSLFLKYGEELAVQYRDKLRARYGYEPALITALLSEGAPPLFSLL